MEVDHVDDVIDSTLTSKTFIKKTRSGAILKIVREHYLRERIACGALHCRSCAPLRALDWNKARLIAPPEGEGAPLKSSLCPGAHYLVPDTNVVLHQVSAFEFPV